MSEGRRVFRLSLIWLGFTLIAYLLGLPRDDYR